MTNDGTDFNHYTTYTDIALETTDENGYSTWDEPDDNLSLRAHLQLDDGNDIESTVGCFTKYILNVYISDGTELCNATLCIGGSLYVMCGSMTEGCDKFPVYISPQDNGTAVPGATTTDNALDADNMTTLI
jgi:hypothetical protein